jgi:plasmid stabilization system protein ParE
MELVFDDLALVDLEEIFDWIAQDSPATAKIVIDRLFSSTELLISFPLMGYVGRDPDTLNGRSQDCPISWCTRLIRRSSELSSRQCFMEHRTVRATTDSPA